MIRRLLFLACCLGFGAPLARAGVELERQSPQQWTVRGDAYRCLLLPSTMTAVLELKVADRYVPLTFRASRLIVWQEPWQRVFESNTAVKAPEIKTGADGVRISFCEQNANIECRSTYFFRPDRVTFSAALTFRREVKGFRRATYEFNPAWTLVRGGQLEYLRPDGHAGHLDLPTQATPDAAYRTLLNGAFTRLRLGAFPELPGAAVTFTGDFSGSLEQTADLFRWHLGAVAAEPAAVQAAGSTLNLELTLAFTPPATVGRRTVEAQIDVDAARPGNAIRPELFGVHLGNIGRGIKTSSMRHPWQNDFQHDPEALRYASEAGVTFFRVYLHHLYDVLGWNGSDPSRGPISPAEGAPCDYSRIDSFMAGLKRAGIDLVPCVALYCPPWLSTRRPSDKYTGLWMIHRAPPKDNAKWAAIIAGLVRYCNLEKGWDIRLWMPANEPDNPSRYWIGGSLTEFCDYFRTAARAMKTADPRIRITGPDLSNINVETRTEPKLLWRDEFVRRCRNDFDLFSFNCYGHDDFTLFVRAARAALAAQGRANCPIYLAEYNITAGDYDQPGVFNFTGAAFLARSLRSLIENGVDRASFFSWDQPALGFFDYAPDGRLIPRPAYYVFKMHAALGNLKNGFVLPCRNPAGELAVLAAQHHDGRGYTVVISADAPTRDFAVTLKFASAAAGDYALRTYQLVPDRTLTELPAETRSLTQPLRLALPGRAVTMLVFRRP